MVFKKILAYISAMMLCCGVVATPQVADSFTSMVVSAEDNYSGSCGENCIYSFDSSTGIFTISGSGEMEYYSYPYGCPPWYAYGESIKAVVIEDGVTTIGGAAFVHCTSLESVTIPDSITTIAACAFSGCTSLESVTIPDGVTEIGTNAFLGCISLTSVTIPESVTSIWRYAFYNCTSLMEITIPDGVTEIDSEVFGYTYGESSDFEKIDGFVVKGIAGSQAETYATENGFNFIAIEEENPPITDKFTTTDILNLKKYILGISEDGTNLDFNDDAKVNILDLSTALNQLISK